MHCKIATSLPSKTLLHPFIKRITLQTAQPEQPFLFLLHAQNYKSRSSSPKSSSRGIPHDHTFLPRHFTQQGLCSPRVSIFQTCNTGPIYLRTFHESHSFLCISNTSRHFPCEISHKNRKFLNFIPPNNSLQRK